MRECVMVLPNAQLLDDHMLVSPVRNEGKM